MVRCVTNLEVVAQGYGDAIADGAPDFSTIVLFHLVIFLEWMTRRFSDLLKNSNPIFDFGQRFSGDCEPTPGCSIGVRQLQKYSDAVPVMSYLTIISRICSSVSAWIVTHTIFYVHCTIKNCTQRLRVKFSNDFMYQWRKSAGHVGFTVYQCNRRTYLTIYFSSSIIFFWQVRLAVVLKRFES